MLPSDKADARRVTVNDTDALAALDALLPGKVARVTRSENGVTIIVHRPLSAEDKTAALAILPGASIAT